MTAEERIIKAGKAGEVVNNEAYQEAFQKMRDNAVNAIASTGLKDTDLIVRLKITLELMGQFQKSLDKTLQDGKVARMQIDRGKLMRKVI